MRVTIVIPKSKKDSVNTWMKKHIDKVGGDKTFRIGLSASGNEPATHYWTCFGYMSKNILKNIKTKLGFSKNTDLKGKIETKTGGKVYINKTNKKVLTSEGLKVIIQNEE